MTQRPHEKLEVWQRSIGLCIEIYRITEKFPASEKFGLVSQMRRSALSVPSNIAEGAGGGSRNVYIRSLNVARGSLAELETQLEVSRRLNFIDSKTFERLRMETDTIGKMLTSLVRALRLK